MKRRLRVALYSHDSMGLGHTRRNLLIAGRLAAEPCRASVLMITGARESTLFRTPPGVDYLTLPGLHKRRDGTYHTRSLGVELERLVALRSATIRSALEAFAPDVVVVDKRPRGVFGELVPALETLRGRTRFVLGLRDVLDEPEAVRQEWARDASAEALDAFYDAVWVYGDPAVYDTIREYEPLRLVAGRARYTGYLDPRSRLDEDARCSGELIRRLDLPPGRLVLCHVGGGQDGGRVAESFAAAELPPETNAILVTGPFLPADVRRRIQRRVVASPRKRAIDFVAEPGALLHRADRVVSMGGYNSVCEILSLRKRALVVPRVTPRREQWIRAERLGAMGLVDVLHPDDLGPEALSEWMGRDATAAPPPRHVDFGGLRRLPRLLNETAGAEAGAEAASTPAAVGF